MVTHQSDTKVTCPECREELTLSPPLQGPVRWVACSFTNVPSVAPLLEELGETRRDIAREVMADDPIRTLIREVWEDTGIDALRQQIRRAIDRETERWQAASAARVLSPTDSFVHQQAKVDERVHKYARDLLNDLQDGLI